MPDEKLRISDSLSAKTKLYASPPMQAMLVEEQGHDLMRNSVEHGQHATAPSRWHQSVTLKTNKPVTNR